MKNSGTTLKSIAAVVLALSIIGDAILLIVWLVSASHLYVGKDVAVAAAIVMAVVMLILAWISFCVTNALGDAAENSFVILERLNRLESKMNGLNGATDQPTRPAPAASKVRVDASGEWTCKKCSEKNAANTRMCKSCGDYR